jgi:TetR/AcrR family transcriptional repressor of nem operon
MENAGLTIGGFHKHFRSREDLVGQALGSAFGRWQRRAQTAAEGGPPFTYEMLVDNYLNESHRDGPGDGCPVGALAGEISRSGNGSHHQRTIRMTNPIQTIVGEPNWARFELAIPASELSDFMYMGRAGEIELYKHRLTLRYLNIGRNSQSFYRYFDGHYIEINQAAALEHMRG